jgi:hypothetical protein
MNESKRTIPAIDDVEFIARRMKEIAAEKVPPPDILNDLPSDVEPTMWVTPYTSASGEDRLLVANVPVTGPNGEAASPYPSIYNEGFWYSEEFWRLASEPTVEEFWEPLIREGVIKVGEA